MSVVDIYQYAHFLCEVISLRMDSICEVSFDAHFLWNVPVVYLEIVGKTMGSNQSISLNNFNSCRVEVQLSSYNSISGKILRGCKKL